VFNVNCVIINIIKIISFTATDVLMMVINRAPTSNKQLIQKKEFIFKILNFS